ncbi:hypothetical protein ACFVWN_07410 [Nocardiopsis flavescens]|uniref:hypothetical protein n=1 Tax=Nocardiopsis flavescens TaxID=758803 RepID=UPI003647AE3B
MTTNSAIRHSPHQARHTARRPYAAEELRAGMLVIDPDGRLGLHEEEVRVVADADQLDIYCTADVVVDYEVAGTAITGRFTSPRLATVWVVGGDGRC